MKKHPTSATQFTQLTLTRHTPVIDDQMIGRIKRITVKEPTSAIDNPALVIQVMHKPEQEERLDISASHAAALALAGKMKPDIHVLSVERSDTDGAYIHVLDKERDAAMNRADQLVRTYRFPKGDRHECR